MRFSIVIPAYNAERTLERCLQSVLDQTYQEYEAIIVDDGSTDKTQQIVTRFLQMDDRFRYVHQKNRGVSATRNLGIAIAKGEYISFLDSDDQYLPTFLEEFNTIINKYPEYDIFCCGYRSVNVDGDNIGVTVLHETRESCILPRGQIMDLHERALDAALWNKVYRRRIIEEYNIRMDESMSLGEDLLFNFAYLDVCSPDIVINNKALYLYTKTDGGTLDSKYRPDLKDIYIKINNQLFFYLKRWNISPCQFDKFYNGVFYMLERVFYNTFRPECPMEMAEKVKYNNEILRSDYFRSIVNKTTCYIHPLYRFAYRIARWEFVMMLNALLKIKNSLLKK